MGFLDSVNGIPNVEGTSQIQTVLQTLNYQASGIRCYKSIPIKKLILLGEIAC